MLSKKDLYLNAHNGGSPERKGLHGLRFPLRLMKKKKSKNKLNKLQKALRRAEAGKQGYYDGRYKSRVEISPKHKKPKHKGGEEF